jgi:acyl-coenzyme A synthetase/AMP-(fatty) acid ligase
MLRAGLAAGDRLVTAVPNGPLFAAVWAASLEAGASPILIHAETPIAELERIAERWGAQFVIMEGEGRSQGGESLSAGQYGSLLWQRVESPGSGRQPATFSSAPLNPTSGTSGGPKVAVSPGPCAVAEPLHYIETLSINRADVILCVIPMSHAYAYGMCFMVALLTSADLVFMRRFNPALAQRALNQMNISVFPAVPVVLNFLATHEAGLTSRPRVLLSAGEPLTRRTFDAFRDRYGLRIRPLYGTTETGGISIGLPEDEFEGSVGPPMTEVEVSAFASSGQDFGSDMGVLRVRSSSVMAGYLEDGGVDRSPLPDGWFDTGDLGRIDAKGRIHLQGRLSDVINVFRYKVVPREVEEVILLLPEVAEVKVYRGQWHEQDCVEAVIVCRGNLDEDRILKHCQNHLVGYKCPTAIQFLDSLPRTVSGKVAIERLSH